jgi:signal recognition particle subunit SRP54
MFENLSERLSGVFDRLTKQGALSEDDVKTALREVRVALLEADVSLPVAREFVKKVQDQATGQAVTKSVTPGQQVVKIVHDALVDTLKGAEDPGRLKIDNPPAPILMVGLQGGGKTTTTGKIAKRLKERERQKASFWPRSISTAPPRWTSWPYSAHRSALTPCPSSKVRKPSRHRQARQAASGVGRL